MTSTLDAAPNMTEAHELAMLDHKARVAGWEDAQDAIEWGLDADQPLEIVARWHDETHTDPRHFCNEEPCKSLIREGWRLDQS